MKRILILLTVCTSLASCTNSTSSKQNNDTIVVRTAVAKQLTSNAEQSYTFISKPYKSVDLSFRVGGLIDYFQGQTGKFYTQGETIAKIDSRDFIIRKQKAQATYEQLESEFNRVKILFEKNNISASGFEKAKADYLSAKAIFETTQNELHDTRLTAPFSGYVGEKYIECHQDIKPTQPVVSFEDLSNLKIEAFVSQNTAYEIQNIKTAHVKFDAAPNDIFVVEIEQVSKSTTKNNLSYLVTARIANSDKKLLSGMSGQIFFDSPDSPTSIVVTQGAVCHSPVDGDYVWVVDPQAKQVHKQKVTLGNLLSSGGVTIEQGVETGEMVAVSGLRFLSDGMNVKIAEGEDNQLKR